MTHAQASALVAKWQQRLGLGEWTIAVQMVNGKELDDDGWGRVHRNPDLLEAVIVLPTGQSRRITEKTIAHELIHLVLTEAEDIFDVASRSDKRLQKLYDNAQERICNRIAAAITGVSSEGIVTDPLAMLKPGEEPANGN